jgi:hypothetical protein
MPQVPSGLLRTTTYSTCTVLYTHAYRKVDASTHGLGLLTWKPFGAPLLHKPYRSHPRPRQPCGFARLSPPPSDEQRSDNFLPARTSISSPCRRIAETWRRRLRRMALYPHTCVLTTRFVSGHFITST